MAAESTPKFDPACECDSPGSVRTFALQVCMPIHGKVQCIDRCIHHLIAALNAGGVETIASCCGHGQGPGRIDLADGRVLALVPKGGPVQLSLSDAQLRSRQEQLAKAWGMWHEPATGPGEPASWDALLERAGELAEVRLEDLQAERDAFLAELADPCSSTDPMHPDGRCRCAGEGKCSWCLRTRAREQLREFAGLIGVLADEIAMVAQSGSGKLNPTAIDDYLKEAFKTLNSAQGSAGSAGAATREGADGGTQTEAVTTPAQPAEPAGAQALATAKPAERLVDYKLPWKREALEIRDAAGDLVACATSGTDAAFIVARCNDQLKEQLTAAVQRVEDGYKDRKHGDLLHHAFYHEVKRLLEGYAPEPPVPVPQPGQVWRMKDGPRAGQPVVIQTVYTEQRQVAGECGGLSLMLRFDQLRPEGAS